MRDDILSGVLVGLAHECEEEQPRAAIVLLALAACVLCDEEGMEALMETAVARAKMAVAIADGGGQDRGRVM